MVVSGLVVILLLVLTLPFFINKIEENLELFLFSMGLAAVLVAGKLNSELILEALKEPVMIALAVLAAGTLFFIFKKHFAKLMAYLLKAIPVGMVVFGVVLMLGLLSSVITAIIASIILVEVIFVLPMHREQKIVVCVLACFSIGLGASLTPLGEPLATIAISKLDEEFFFLLKLLGKYIVPAVIVFSIAAGIYSNQIIKSNNCLMEANVSNEGEAGLQENDFSQEEDTWKGIIVRALKVYLFVMALVFLGEGFEPLINAYILGLSPKLLYWVNMVSAVLDNATLCAAEISPAMSKLTVEAILMGLLVSGGMLIPGNIPNIISASKLKITSKEWAVIGMPVGLLSLVIFYLVLPF